MSDKIVPDAPILPAHPIHPYYGPCDGFVSYGPHENQCCCSECKRIFDFLAARVADLEDKLAQAEQVSGEYCEKCGWAMKFPNQPYRCELEAKNKALTAEIKELKGLLEQRFAKRNDETFAEFRGRISAEAWRYSRVQSIDGILESLSRAVELARVLREREAT